MAESNANQEELNCGFCLQKLTYMIEPKQLPCSHVFCLPCLEEDPKKDCPVCRTVRRTHHTILIITTHEKKQWSEREKIYLDKSREDVCVFAFMNKVTGPSFKTTSSRRVYDAQWNGMKSLLRPSETDSDTTTDNREDNSDHIKCDVCKDQKAVCYCLECEKILCDQHFKIHEQSSIFFASKHQQIDIAVYASNPEKYTPVYCSDHEDQKLTVGCNNCYKVFCPKCQPKVSGCSQSKVKGGFHTTYPITMMADNIRVELNAQIKKIADQVTEGLNLEKKSWSNLYDVECEVTQMMSEIDERVEKAIKNIRESAEVMKNELREHQAKSVSVVEAYSSQLTAQRDSLETQWKELNRRFQDMKGSEVITQFESLKRSIEASPPALYKSPPEFAPRPKTLSQRPALKSMFTEGIFAQMSIADPKSIRLRYLKTLPANGANVYSVTWQGKDIIYGTNNGVHLVNEQLPNKQVNIRGHVHCIRRIDKYAFAILLNKIDSTEQEVRISCINTLADPKTALCRYPREKSSLLHLSVSNQYIAAGDDAKKVVQLWTTSGEHLMELGSGHLRRPLGVLLQEDSVLVADIDADCIHKFRLQADSEPVWTCRGLSNPTGICVDKHGNLYVTSLDGDTIYIITKEGVLIKKLRFDELSKTQHVLDISLSDDETTLALACRAEGVKLFSLLS